VTLVRLTWKLNQPTLLKILLSEEALIVNTQHSQYLPAKIRGKKMHFLINNNQKSNNPGTTKLQWYVDSWI
jgi:hypothetical protein